MINPKSNVMLPLLACDRLVLAVLREAWSTPELLEEIGALFFTEEGADHSRALFDYLFVAADCPAIGAGNSGVRFYLRDREDRLRHASEARPASARHIGHEVLVVDGFDEMTAPRPAIPGSVAEMVFALRGDDPASVESED